MLVSLRPGRVASAANRAASVRLLYGTARPTSTTERATLLAPSRALVLLVTALAPSTMATTPSTPTSRIVIATSTSIRVKPRWPEEDARMDITRVLGCPQAGLERPGSVWPKCDADSVRAGIVKRGRRARGPAFRYNRSCFAWLPGAAGAAARVGR